MKFMTVPPDTVTPKINQRLFQSALVLSVFHLLILILGSRFFDLERSENRNQPRDMAIAIIKAESPEWAQRWYHWDALWFVHLSRFGYQLQRDSEGNIGQYVSYWFATVFKTLDSTTYRYRMVASDSSLV